MLSLNPSVYDLPVWYTLSRTSTTTPSPVAVLVTGVPDRAVPGPLFAVRWTGWLVPPKPGKVRLWARCDGKTWVRPWKGNSPHDCFSIGHLADLELNYEGKPLPIRIDFAKTQPKADLSLEWSRDGGATREAIPPEVLFHTEADALKAAGRQD